MFSSLSVAHEASLLDSKMNRVHSCSFIFSGENRCPYQCVCPPRERARLECPYHVPPVVQFRHTLLIDWFELLIVQFQGELRVVNQTFCLRLAKFLFTSSSTHDDRIAIFPIGEFICWLLIV